MLSFTTTQDGKDDIVADLDMSNGLFGEVDQYHYFKVAVYRLKNTSDADEYAQATF